MKKFTLTLAVLTPLCFLVLWATPARAQATRTWVSGVGDDVNPCSRTAPCKTFAGAISKTAINGEINVLSPGGFGAVTITKSTNIDCHDMFAGLTTGTGNGIVVTIAAGNANDPLRTARIRNVDIHGGGLSGSVGTRLGINGIRIDNAAQVSIEDCLITDFTQNAIRDQRTTGGRLTVTNTIARNSNNSGLLVLPSSGSTKIDVVVDNTILEGNATGIAAANGPAVAIKRSTISNNTGNGLDAEGTAVMTADSCAVSSNGSAGLFTAAGGTLRVSNSDIANNGSAANGAWTSFGNNRITGPAGTAPTAAGPASSDLGQN
jgi:Right handed beta helix region